MPIKYTPRVRVQGDVARTMHNKNAFWKIQIAFNCGYRLPNYNASMIFSPSQRFAFSFLEKKRIGYESINSPRSLFNLL